MSSVLYELDTDAFADGAVGLFALNTHFFEDDSTAHGCSAKWIGFDVKPEGPALVVAILPSEMFSQAEELACAVQPPRVGQSAVVTVRSGS